MQEKKTTTINPFNKKFYGKDNGFVGGVIEDFANIKTLKFWKKDSIKNLAKGVSKSIIIAVPMITVGLLLGPLGPLFAIGGAVVMGAMTPKIASVLGFKGIQKSSEHRFQDRLDSVTPQNIQKKRKQLKKAGFIKKILGAIACVFGVVATVLTGGTALPIVFAGAMIIYSGKKDADLAKKVKGMGSKKLYVAALALGFIKQKDLDKLNEQEKAQDKGNQEAKLSTTKKVAAPRARSYSEEVQNRQSSGLGII